MKNTIILLVLTFACLNPIFSKNPGPNVGPGEQPDNSILRINLTGPTIRLEFISHDNIVIPTCSITAECGKSCTQLFKQDGQPTFNLVDITQQSEFMGSVTWHDLKHVEFLHSKNDCQTTSLPLEISKKLISYLINGKPKDHLFDCNCFALHLLNLNYQAGDLDTKLWNFHKLESDTRPEIGDLIVLMTKRNQGTFVKTDSTHFAMYVGNGRYLSKIGEELNFLMVHSRENLQLLYDSKHVFLMKLKQSEKDIPEDKEAS